MAILFFMDRPLDHHGARSVDLVRSVARRRTVRTRSSRSVSFHIFAMVQSIVSFIIWLWVTGFIIFRVCPDAMHQVSLSDYYIAQMKLN